MNNSCYINLKKKRKINEIINRENLRKKFNIFYYYYCRLNLRQTLSKLVKNLNILQACLFYLSNNLKKKYLTLENYSNN